MSSTASLSVNGYVISDLAHNNSDLLAVAKRLRELAVEVDNPFLQERFATEINRLLDIVERNDRVVRSVVPVR
jgi:hypothetical protein